MKKLYAFLVAAAVVASASAGLERHAINGEIKLPVLNSELNAKTVDGKALKKAKKLSTKAIAEDGISGDYGWFGESLLNNDLGYTCTIELTDAATGATHIELAGTFNLEATYNAAEGTLTIPTMQVCAHDEDGDVFFFLKDTNPLTGQPLDGASDATETVGTISSDGSIVFERTDVWAIGTPDENMYFYTLSYANEFDVLIDWTYLGTAQWNENIIYGAFTGEENTAVAEVNLYEHPDIENLYYIEDAYQTLYKDLGFNSVSPDLYIDAADPNDVWVELQSIGISGGADGVYYIFNEGWYAWEYQEDIEDPSLYCTQTFDGNGGFTITFPYHSCTLFASGSGKFYYGSSYVSTLTFVPTQDGVSNVATDNANAPVEYYNLQGVRVNNPNAGQLVIKKQGNAVSKVLVK